MTIKTRMARAKKDIKKAVRKLGPSDARAVLKDEYHAQKQKGAFV